jgi:hypothetical protein
MSTPSTPVLWRLVAAVPIVGLYVLSLFLPVFVFETHEPVTGLTVLMLGWVGLLGLILSWLANPFFLAGLILLLIGEFRISRWIALAGLVIALQSFTVDAWWFNEGSSTPITAFGAGFYVWFGSLVLLWVSVLVFRRIQLAGAPSTERAQQPSPVKPIKGSA